MFCRWVLFFGYFLTFSLCAFVVFVPFVHTESLVCLVWTYECIHVNVSQCPHCVLCFCVYPMLVYKLNEREGGIEGGSGSVVAGAGGGGGGGLCLKRTHPGSSGGTNAPPTPNPLYSNPQRQAAD